MRTAPAEVAPKLKTLGDALAAALPSLVFAYLFGSAARGDATPRSDVDVALFVAPDADPHRVRLEAARLASLHLGSDAVDVVVLNTAPIALAGRVLTSRQVIVDRQPFVRHRYESATARAFQDFRLRERRLLAHRFARG